MSMLLAPQNDNLLRIRISGKLNHDDYETFTPLIETLIQEHGSVRLLVELIDFDGWTASALWDDLKFDWKHYNDIDKIALVGDSRWEKGMELFCKPFTGATVKFFQPEEIEAAEQWVAA